MARGKRGKYRMTPRRRAALKKAQQASARRRRNQKVKTGLKIAGYVAAATAASTAAYAINNESRKFAKNPEAFVRSYKGWFSAKLGKSSGINPPVPKSPSVPLTPTLKPRKRMSNSPNVGSIRPRRRR